MKVKKLLPGGLLRPLMRKMVAATQRANMKKTPEIAKDEFENIKSARSIVQKSGMTVNNKKIDTDFLSLVISIIPPFDILSIDLL